MTLHYLIPLFLYFVSGFCGLVYEVVWSRMLVLVMGNTTYATSTILASFMAGLSLGSYFWGKKIDRGKSSPLFVFGCLEIIIGVSAIALYFAIQYAVPVEIFILKWTAGLNTGVIAVRFLFSFLLLCLPTFFMGGTFTVIGKYLIGREKGAGSKSALLYGINTLGALLGAFFTGFFLIAIFGHFKVHIATASLNILTGFAAISLFHLIGKKAAPPIKSKKAPVTKPKKSSPIPGSVMVLVLLGTVVAGFSTMAYQVLWTRILVLVIDNSVYSFTCIVMMFLGGIALGSLMAVPLLRSKKFMPAVFALLHIGFAVSAFMFPFIIHPMQVPAETRYYAFLIDRLPFLTILPAIFSGILLPLAVHIYKAKTAKPGSRLGSIYALNTLGCVLGALAVSFWLIPKLGFRNTMLLLPALSLLVGGLIALIAMPRRYGIPMTVSVLIMAIIGIIIMPADHFKSRYAELEPQSRLIYYEESIAATATIFDRPDASRVFYLNGIPEVDTSLLSVMTFRLMGALPNLLHPKPQRALMITFGAGITTATAAKFVPEIECVDIADQAENISRNFIRINDRIHENNKFTLVVDDARHFLQHTNKKYSVIVSDATHPRVYDSWVLFTKEFYTLVKSTLAQNGIFCQWVPFHGLHPDQYTAIINTFAHIFPNTSIWRVKNAYSLMIATPAPLTIDFKLFYAKLNQASIQKHLREVGLESPFYILQFFSIGPKRLAQLKSSSPPLLTDNSPHHLFFPWQATFKEQYDLWPQQNAENIAQHEESVASYLINIGDTDMERNKIIRMMKYIERLHANKIR